MGHQTAALQRSVAAGAPLEELRATTWEFRVDDWGRPHPKSCTEVAKNAPTIELGFDEILAGDPSVDNARLTDPVRGRAPTKSCHAADAITGPLRQHLREIDSRARLLIEIRDWLAHGQVPFAVTSRARLRQNALLRRFPGIAELTEADNAWLQQATTDADAALDAALLQLPGATSSARLASMLDLLAHCVAATGPYDGPRSSRNPVGVVAREALAVALSGAEVNTKAMSARLQGRGAPARWATPAFSAAHAAAVEGLAAGATVGVRSSSSELRLAAFVLGANLDIPKDGLAGLAAAACWTVAEDVVTRYVPKTAPGPRARSRGFLIAPADLVDAAARVVQLERTTAPTRGFTQAEFDVIDLGPWTGEQSLHGNEVLDTTLRIWSGEGPMSDARVAYDAAAAVHI